MGAIGKCCCEEAGCDCDVVRDDLPETIAVLGIEIDRADWADIGNCCWFATVNIDGPWGCDISDLVYGQESDLTYTIDEYAAPIYTHVGVDDPPSDTATVCLDCDVVRSYAIHVNWVQEYRIYVRRRVKSVAAYLSKADAECTPGVVVPCRWVLVLHVRYEFQFAVLDWITYLGECEATSYDACYPGGTSSEVSDRLTDEELCALLSSQPSYFGYVQRELFLDEADSTYEVTQGSQVDCTLTSPCVDMEFEDIDAIVTSSDPTEFGLELDSDYVCESYAISRVCRRLWFFSGVWYWEGTDIDGFDPVILATTGTRVTRDGIIFNPSTGADCGIPVVNNTTYPACFLSGRRWPPGSGTTLTYFVDPQACKFECADLVHDYSETAYVERQIIVAEDSTWSLTVTW